MKLAGVFGALLVITAPVFAATPPGSASASQTCSFGQLSQKTVAKCDNQPCTFAYVSSDGYTGYSSCNPPATDTDCSKLRFDQCLPNQCSIISYTPGYGAKCVNKTPDGLTVQSPKLIERQFRGPK